VANKSSFLDKFYLSVLLFDPVFIIYYSLQNM